MNHRTPHTPTSTSRRPRPLRRITAGLTLTAAALTGTALIHDHTAPQADTAWAATVTIDTTIVTPLDTAWGD